MFCTNCGFKLSKYDSFCQKCGTPIKPNIVSQGISLDTDDQRPKKRSTIVRVGAFLGAFILVSSIVSGVYDAINEEDTQEVKNIINDTLNNSQTASPENQKYTDALKKVFEYYKNENASLIALDKQIAASDLMEYSSFKNQSSLQNHITILSRYLDELKRLKKSQAEVSNKGKEIFANSDLSASEIDVVMKSWDESSNDPTMKDLRNRRYDSLMVWTESVLNLYKFMSKNFSNYTLDKDSYGEDQVFFETDTQVDEYNNLNERISIQSQDFLKIDKQFRDYSNKKFTELGLGISVDDVENYLYK